MATKGKGTGDRKARTVDSDADKPDEQFELSARERSDAEDKLPPSVQVLHEIIRMQGQEEMRRSVAALGWSALAAGLSMGFSVLARALLHAYLPDAPWRFLVENLGYSVGFLVVILARQQLFTENTMTAVLPAMTKPSGHAIYRLLRLWCVVLVGNLLGVAVFAYCLGHMQLLDAPVRAAVVLIGEHVLGNSSLQMFTKGIVAGWLIATMVWLVPAAHHAKITVIVLMTYLIGIGGFTHIIVGSVEMLFLVFDGRLSMADYMLMFALPTLAGNIVGGSLIFALISHAQVRSDDG